MLSVLVERSFGVSPLPVLCPPVAAVLLLWTTIVVAKVLVFKVIRELGERRWE